MVMVVDMVEVKKIMAYRRRGTIAPVLLISYIGRVVDCSCGMWGVRRGVLPRDLRAALRSGLYRRLMRPSAVAAASSRTPTRVGTPAFSAARR